MKKNYKIVILLLLICFFLVGCTINNADNYANTEYDYGIFDMYDLYVLQSSSEYEKDECSDCLSDIDEIICNRVERVEIDGEELTLSEALNEKKLTINQVECLINHNIVKHYRMPYLLYKVGEIIFSIIKGL